jgi:hypothetical protein
MSAKFLASVCGPFFKKNPTFRKQDLFFPPGEHVGRHVTISFAEKQLLSVTRRRGRLTIRAIPSSMFHRCNSLELLFQPWVQIPTTSHDGGY